MAEPSTGTTEGVPGEGTIRWYSPAKGYGFLNRTGEDEDIFVHYSSVDGEPNLESGDRVRFEVFTGPKGLLARGVKRIR